jgi:hypothetical protein
MGIMYMTKGDKKAARKMLEGARAVFKKHNSKLRLAEVEKDLKDLGKIP